ncbi:transporter substrate-binding domain-containing protein [Nocardioides sp.]|uniref:transporter substrate-binding domain-containing protein n=1 Tax=Nocardioides sp. TaxID=35761 RepID=UPI003D0E1437
MNRFVSRVPLAIVTVVAVALTTAACGSSGDASSPDTSTADNAAYAAARDALPARIKDAGVLRFVGASNPPFRIISGSTVEGADAEMAVAIGEVLGVKTSFDVSSDGDSARTGILADRYDVYMGPSLLDAERHEQFDGVTTASLGAALVVKKDNAEIESDEDLCGRKLAEVTGSSFSEKFVALSDTCEADGMEPIDIIQLGDPQTVILAVLSGRVDAGTTTNTAAADATRTDESLKVVHPTTPGISETVEAGLLTLPDTSEALFEAYKVLIENGTYNSIMEKWNMKDAEIEEPKLNDVAEE